MAAGKFKTYEKTIDYLHDGTIDIDDATNWKMAIFLSTSNANDLTLAAPIYGNLTNEHANANGYTTGGIALTNVTFGRTGQVLTIDCDNPVWTASGGSITGRFLVVYKNATVNSVVKPCLCVCLMDTTPADVTATTTNTLTVTINASGVITITGASTD
jgi:hypothetical protein